MIDRRRHPGASAPVSIAVAGIAAGVLILLLIFSGSKSPHGRETYVIASDPVTVVSRNVKDKTVVIVTLPSDITAEGTHGYGIYSLAAFWRLGEIDKKDGTVLAESISEALGIPVAGYIGPKTGLFSAGTDALDLVKRVFSFRSALSFMTGRYRTNIPFENTLRFAWSLSVARGDKIRVYAFSRPALVAQDRVLPDGSRQYVLDKERLDAQLKSVFEDTKVRTESVTVAVYNTTAMPEIGSRVARQLTNLGVSVVTVGNDMPPVDQCTVSGGAQALKSESAAVITALFDCLRIDGAESRADLVLRVGEAYAKRFVPN